MSAPSKPLDRVELSRAEIRLRLAGVLRRNDFRAKLAIGVDLTSFAVLFALAAGLQSAGLRLACAVGVGLFMARLFVLGHDVCHGSIFSGSKVRPVLGRILFLTTLSPYSTWQLGHNSAHHGFSNLKGRDLVWAPFSPSEFAALPARRRLLERVYRSPAGQGLYYLIELWWKELYFPKWMSQKSMFRVDCWLVTLYGLAALGGAFAIGAVTSPSAAAGGAWAVFAACLLPFAVWNQVMGLVIYLHHTHPAAKWSAGREDWSFHAGQIESTIHAGLPLGLHRVLHNIMEHTAHHADVSIPYYDLQLAQQRLDGLLGEKIIRQPWSWSAFLQTTRTCRLFDFERGAWCDFRSDA